MGFFSDTLWNIFDLFTTPPLGTLTEKPSRLPYACIKDENGVTLIGGERKLFDKEMRRKLGIQGMDGRSLLEMFTHEEVYPIEGSVVCCLLGVVADHSGIYVGNGRIIHRDGAGFLAEVSQNEFLERLDGWNPAVTVFVSCRGDEPVGSSEIAERAREALNDPRHKGYNLLLKNCHQFCHYCLTGQIDNGVTDFAFTSLEKDLRNILGANSWRVWRT